jgi:hypothetical protein
LLSSDGKDRGSLVAFASGFERSLVKSWYLPAYLEGRTQGDQVRDNQSVVATLGLRTALPWKLLSPLKPLLNNAVVKTPFAPDVGIALQNEWRVEQDQRARATFPNKRGLRWFGSANWSPFHLLPGPARDGVIAPGSLALEFAVKGWYLYGNEIQHNRRWQGLVEASLLVPITGLNFQASTGSLTGAEAPKQRVRVKYSAGANESRGFINSTQLSIGFEVIK